MKKFLVIQTASIGDVILATPILESLRKQFPDAQIDFLVKKGMESLFINHPFIHKLLVWNKKEKKYAHLYRLIREIRAESYDAVINVQRYASSGIITALSKGKKKYGFDKNPLSFAFSKKFEHRIEPQANYIHEVHRNLNLLSELIPQAQGEIRLYPSESDRLKVSQFKKQTYICLAPTSLWFTKQFPEEKWIDFIASCPQDLYIYLLGAPADRIICDRIIEQSGHEKCINLSGDLKLLESAALMQDALMNYVNDSAPQHLASAMNAPTTAIFCSTVPEFGFGPLSDDSTIVQIKEQLDCRPCGLHGYKNCPEKHFKCALEIDNMELINRLCKKN